MTEEEGRKFKGFSPKTLKFLRGLKANNSKAWFQAHRADYEEYALQPLRYLVTDLGDFMLDIDPYFEITPSVNKTISRIYRDTRFSKDKSPFRSTVWFTFKNQKQFPFLQNKRILSWKARNTKELSTRPSLRKSKIGIRERICIWFVIER
jgi:uncharacterized protein (DUF2461 family)